MSQLFSTFPQGEIRTERSRLTHTQLLFFFFLLNYTLFYCHYFCHFLKNKLQAIILKALKRKKSLHSLKKSLSIVLHQALKFLFSRFIKIEKANNCRGVLIGTLIHPFKRTTLKLELRSSVA